MCLYTQHTCGFLKKKFKQKEKIFQQSVVTRARKMESAARKQAKKGGSEQQIKNQQKFPFAFILYDLKHISHFTIFLSFPFFSSPLSLSLGLCGGVADEMKRGKKNCFKVFSFFWYEEMKIIYRRKKKHEKLNIKENKNFLAILLATRLSGRNLILTVYSVPNLVEYFFFLNRSFDMEFIYFNDALT